MTASAIQTAAHCPPLPRVSIVMPVYNESKYILRSLRAIIRQTYDLSRMEIIVADGNSSDGTRAAIEQFATTSPVPIALVKNEKKIAPVGLNRAISIAEGEIVIRIDGHCEIDVNYVSNCVKRLVDGTLDAVGGPIQTIGETFTARAIALAMSSPFGVGGSAFRTVHDRELLVDTVAFPGYRRETLKRIGPFNEELVRNQDDELNYRLRKTGGRILLSPEIRSKYFSRSTFRSVWLQYYQYGFWKVRVFQLHPAQMSWRQFVPPLFVVCIVSIALISLFSVPALMLLGGTLGLYFCSATFAAARAVGPLNIKMVPLVVLSFLILHFSYGVGFLKGLIVFYDRWEIGRRYAAADRDA